MPIEKTDTLVVGGGQAGIAMSEHLRNCGVSHLVLERYRVAERWRSERWDSLVANGPAWHDRFPSMTFAEVAADGFPTKQQVTDYFVAYAKNIDAPIRTGVEVTRVQRLQGKPGYRVDTSDGVIEAVSVVAATGAFHHPVVPSVVPQQAGLTQMHSTAYRNPQQLPGGAVLVVGAGSSGSQIADELSRSGKRVYLSVGPHERPPRRYRGRDFCWWLGVLGKWDAAAVEAGTEHVTIAVSGAYGGNTIDFRRLASQGITLLGRTQAFDSGVLSFAANLAKTISHGDDYYLNLLDEADAYILANGLDLPEEPEARHFDADPDCVSHPIPTLDLAEAGISTIIWATGFSVDYSWLQVDTFDVDGRPLHQRGVSEQPGIYFLGLPWQSRRGSSFIWGVWHDAKFLADHIVTQRGYLEHHQHLQANQIAASDSPASVT